MPVGLLYPLKYCWHLLTLPQVKKWLLFDLDNTIIDTEQLAFQSAVSVCNRILESKGVKERYSDMKLLSQFFGQPWSEMLRGLRDLHKFEATEEELKMWAKWEEAAIIEGVKKEGQPTRGVEDVIKKILAEKKYGLAIVSSSTLARIWGCLDGVKLQDYFDPRFIFSAKTSLEVPAPKPASDIYEFALESLGITAHEALAVEDSLGGLMAASGAGIDTIGYLGCSNMPIHQAQLAHDFEEQGAKASMLRWDQFFGLLAEVEAQE